MKDKKQQILKLFKMKNKKQQILKLLKKGDLSTTKIASLIKANHPRTLELLKELAKEKKVKKIEFEQLNVVYWSLK